jgi:two-component system response regulator HydG
MSSLAPNGAPQSSRQILVVDDLPEIGDFFRALMRRMKDFDIQITTEVNSQRALELVEERTFDLVISDFRMRQVDGIEVLSAARKKNPDGLRVLMTGYNEIPTSMERIRGAKIDAYVQKPLRSQDVLLLIFDLLSGNAVALERCRADARELEVMGSREESLRGMVS